MGLRLFMSFGVNVFIRSYRDKKKMCTGPHFSIIMGSLYPTENKCKKLCDNCHFMATTSPLQVQFNKSFELYSEN